MSKLYIFGIGGTGARVLRSLTMLLAAGVECGADTIVPIVIDRDIENKDLERTKSLIENYVALNKELNGNSENKFFKTKIELLKNGLFLQLTDGSKSFEEYIGKDSMNNENKALVDMLFSEKTLNLKMADGFQGNPNIGSVVLNQFEDNEVFQEFANNFTDPNNKIFIISSIFGGTGASGFPLLLKILRYEKSKLNNWDNVHNAIRGAISVLPYFNVNIAKKEDDSLVDSNTFRDKTKAALTYYMEMDKQLDTLYYIADPRASTYDHYKGGENQKNNAHFVELAAALSILDFVNPKKTGDNIHRDGGTISKTIYKEFGIRRNNDKTNCLNIEFDNLWDETKNILVNPLSRFFLFGKYMKEIFNEQYKYQPYAHKRFDSLFMRTPFMEKLQSVQSLFFAWLKEMQSQDRKFSPFNLGLSSTDAFNFVNGNIDVIRKANRFDALRYKSWARMDNELNRQNTKIKSNLTNPARFMELFYKTTESLIEYKQ